MARTHKAIRTNLKRIVEIRKDIIPALTEEVYDRGERLGLGTFRLVEEPNHKVVIAEPRISGYTVAWKDVAFALASRYNIPPSEVMAVASGYRKQANRNGEGHLRVSLAKDPIKDRKNVKGIIV